MKQLRFLLAATLLAIGVAGTLTPAHAASSTKDIPTLLRTIRAPFGCQGAGC